MRYPRLTVAVLALLGVGALISSAQPALGATLPLAPANHAQPGAATGAAYGGDAYAIALSGVSVEGSPIPSAAFGSTGPVPTTGGAKSSPPGTITLPGGLGTLSVTAASVAGAAGTVDAGERVGSVSLLPNIRPSGAGLCLPLVGCVSDLVSGLSSASVGGVLTGLLGGEGSSPSRGHQLSDLLDIGLAQSSASASATDPAANAETTQVGSISLLGGAVNVPIDPAPDTKVNLGLLELTFNRRSYDSATNSASAEAVILDFPAGGQLASAITGTITLASSTATSNGIPTCPLGVTVGAVTPSSGPVAGGTPVTITGTGFLPGDTVAFGTVPATNVTVTTPTTIQATSPPQPAGTETVSVNGCPISTAAFAYHSSELTRKPGRCQSTLVDCRQIVASAPPSRLARSVWRAAAAASRVVNRSR